MLTRSQKSHVSRPSQASHVAGSQSGRFVILCGVLFLSGTGALIFETLWLRLSGLAFGNSIWAAALILSSFMALMTKGQLDEAIAQLSKAVEILPNYSHAQYNLGLALAEKGETIDAIAHYEKAIEARPDFLEALTNLAWIFASSSDANIRNGPKAVELAEKAFRLTGDTSPVVLRTLAAAYATNKSFDKALETSRRALQSAQEQHNFELAETIRSEMSLYEVGLPFTSDDRAGEVNRP